MAKYSVWVEKERETGTRHPAPLKVTWGCTHLPSTRVADGTTDIDADNYPGGISEAIGIFEAIGISEAIKHAEANGETLTREDIEVTVEQVTLVVKRGNVVNVHRPKSVPRMASARIFEEVNVRKRPLGSAV